MCDTDPRHRGTGNSLGIGLKFRAVGTEKWGILAAKCRKQCLSTDKKMEFVELLRQFGLRFLFYGMAS